MFNTDLLGQVPSTGLFGEAKDFGKDSKFATDTSKAALGVHKQSATDSSKPNADRTIPNFGTVKSPFDTFTFSGMKG